MIFAPESRALLWMAGFDKTAVPRTLYVRVMPEAPKVPITAEARLTSRAKTSEFIRASNMERSLKSSAYQYRLNPPHIELSLL